jgi:hypothetical protein
MQLRHSVSDASRPAAKIVGIDLQPMVSLPCSFSSH